LRLESLVTTPALYFLTRRTMSTWLSIDWEAKMNDRPPLRASAIAMPLSETACMMEETIGILIRIRLSSSPFR